MQNVYAFDLLLRQDEFIDEAANDEEKEEAEEPFVTHAVHNACSDKPPCTLLALSGGRKVVLILFTNGSRESRKVIRLDRLASKVACSCFSPCGRWLVVVLACGNLRILPVKLYLPSVTFISCCSSDQEILSETSPTFVQSGLRDDCLALPTCCLWYETRSRRPMLIYSNKGGDILFVDLTIQRLSVSLQAPHSIHNLDVVEDFVQNDRFLLVTGFAGTQWLLPLEENGRTLRETLSRIIPSELHEFTITGTVVSAMSNDSKCLAIMYKDRFRLYNSFNFLNPVFELVLPNNTFAVSYTDTITFCIHDQIRAAALINQCCYSEQGDKTVESFSLRIGHLPNERFLGFTILATEKSADGDSQFPSCLFITERAVFFSKPLKSRLQAASDFLLEPGNVTLGEMLCRSLGLELKTVSTKTARSLIKKGTTEHALNLLLYSKIDIIKIAEIFISNDYGEFILPKVDDWISSSAVGCGDKHAKLTDNEKTQLSRLAFDVHLSNLHGFVDCERQKALQKMRTFLSHNTYYDPIKSMQILLSDKQYDAALELMEIRQLNEIVLKHLLNDEKWVISDTFLRLLTLENHSSILTDCRNSLLIDKFLSRLESHIFSYHISKDWLPKILRLYDPARKDVNIIVERAKRELEDKDSRDLSAKISTFYLRKLLYFLFYIENSNDKGHEILESTDGEHILSINRSTPKKICIPLSSCADHSIAIGQDDESDVICWGRNLRGCLGVPDMPNSDCKYSLPITLPVFKEKRFKIIQVACGTEHTMCMSDCGLIFAWGSNRYGQLGLSDKEDRLNPTVLTLPNDLTPVLLRSGQYHNAIISEKQHVFSWGWNVHGQLGHSIIHDVLIPKKIDYFAKLDVKISDVACGQAHTIFLTTDHSVYTCGNNTYGQLGLGSNRIILKKTRPVKLRLVGSSDDDVIVDLIGCGYFHNVIWLRSRRLFTWGTTPQSLKFNAILKKRKLRNTAELEKQQQKQQNTCDQQHQPENAMQNDQKKLVKSDYLNHTRPLEIIADHVITGDNDDDVIVQISCGYHHNCLLTRKGRLFTWGKGLEHQLGHNDRKERLTPCRVEDLTPVNFVACGTDSTIALESETGRLYGWGKNDYAQLGFESVKETERNRLNGKVLTFVHRGCSGSVQLPRDNRFYVTKPTLMTDLKVRTQSLGNAESEDLSDSFSRHSYDVRQLLIALKAFHGFYDRNALQQFVSNPNVEAVLALLCRESERFADIVASGPLSYLLDEILDLLSKLGDAEKTKFLKMFIKRLPTYDFDEYFNANKEARLTAWSSTIAELLTSNENSGGFMILMPSIKIKALEIHARKIRSSQSQAEVPKCKLNDENRVNSVSKKLIRF